ncbi:acylphosphatase [Corynebacterium amycolatum]|uniref:acylphosphatase n=1 Tax=Corynebacterium amycolatum TaxID=43765 RepID=UPI003EE026C7
MSLNDVRLTAWVHGHVQGVGFRWYTRVTALELGLVGYAQNYPDGRVLVVAEGSRADCESLLAWLEGPNTPGDVTTVVPLWQEPKGALSTFDRR